MLRFSLILALATLGLVAHAQNAQPGGLAGKVEGKVYVSPTGAFKVTIPVLPELGGEITDTPNVVTFQDAFNVHISIAAFPQDVTQRWEFSTRGAKDYLIYFFSNVVLADFKRGFPGVQIESAKFIPGTLDGSLITFLLIPGGTMFGDKVPPVGADGQPPIAKRGNLLFVRNGYVFIISIELAEKVIEGKAYKKTTAEEDDTLRLRLNEVIAKLQFAKPATPAAPATTAAK